MNTWLYKSLSVCPSATQCEKISKGYLICLTAPAHPYATDSVVLSALFSLSIHPVCPDGTHFLAIVLLNTCISRYSPPSDGHTNYNTNTNKKTLQISWTSDGRNEIGERQRYQSTVWTPSDAARWPSLRVRNIFPSDENFGRWVLNINIKKDHCILYQHRCTGRDVRDVRVRPLCRTKDGVGLCLP